MSRCARYRAALIEMKREILLASISAVMLVLSFAPFYLGFLAWFAFVPLFFALQRVSSIKQAAFTGLTTGFVFFLGTVYWVVYSMYFYGGVPFIVGAVVTIGLSLYLALFTALFSLALKTLSAFKSKVRLLILAPLLWVAVEFLRSVLLTGAPWVLLGYSQTSYLPLIQLADIGGVDLISFWLVLINSAIYLTVKAVRKKSHREAIACGAFAFFIFAVVFAYGHKRIIEVDASVESWGSMTVAVAQGNIEQKVKWAEGGKIETVDTYIELSKEVAQGEVDLIIWPETAMPFYLYYDPPLGGLVTALAKELKTDFIVGAPHYEYKLFLKNPGEAGNAGENRREYDIYNSAFLITPEDGFADRYDKVHLVPFGEYVPLSKLLFFIDKLTAGIGDFSSGAGALPLKHKRGRIGMLICYEAIFPELAAETTLNGARFLVNLTNDGWFGRTSAPYQHLDMSLMRAVENRTYMVRAANSGISAFIDPTGRITKRTALFERTTLTDTVRLREGKLTVFTIGGRYFPFTCLVISVIVTAVVLVRNRKEY